MWPKRLGVAWGCVCALEASQGVRRSRSEAGGEVRFGRCVGREFVSCEAGRERRLAVDEGRRRKLLVKRVSAHGGCLGTNRRGRTWQAAKSFGELQASEDPEMSEWGNPARPTGRVISRERPTRGIETSQYPEEEKSSRDSPSSGERTGKSPNRRGLNSSGVAGRQ